MIREKQILKEKNRQVKEVPCSENALCQVIEKPVFAHGGAVELICNTCGETYYSIK